MQTNVPPVIDIASAHTSSSCVVIHVFIYIQNGIGTFFTPCFPKDDTEGSVTRPTTC